MKIVAILKRLWLHISSRRRRQLALLLVLMLVSAVAEIVSIGAVLPFLGVLADSESVFQHELAQPYIQLFGITEPGQLLLPLTSGFIVVAFFSGGLRIILLWAQIKLGHAIGADLSYEIYKRTLYKPYSVHVGRNSSEVIAGISTKANQVVVSAVLPVMIIVSSSLFLFAILFTLIAIEPVVALSAIASFGTIYGLIIWRINKRLLQNSHRISRETSQIIKTLQEGLGGIRDVLIDGTQSKYCTAFRSADLPLRRARANNQVLGQSPRYGIESIGMILIAGLAYSLATGSNGLVGVIPILGALALGAQRLLPILQQIYLNWAELRGSQGVLQDAMLLIEQPFPEYQEKGEQRVIPFNKVISLNNIGFRYSNESPWVLRDLSLDIPQGTRIGFIGTTGSGKSTLLDITMGLLFPSEGKFSIDDTVITAKNQRGWQVHIAHVPQSIYLTDATIAENIAFGSSVDEVDHERVKRAAEQAQIAETIELWDLQYQTMVGERGVRLSGGQRQRIGIARALYKQADILILDEATSALDNATEKAVMDAIHNDYGNITILMVAHRLSTLKGCDRIIKLENGIIKRQGTPEEMIEM